MSDHCGMTFGRLTVLRKLTWGDRPTLLCRCSCGTERPFRQDHVLSGRSVSCGCFQKERAKVGPMTHGATSQNQRPPEYSAWVNLKRRCCNPTLKCYKNYGGRGIKVCDRWLDSFANFLEDMGPRASPKHSIDRIDNNGNYEPSNCRWATRTEQNNNQRQRRSLKKRREPKLDGPSG